MVRIEFLGPIMHDPLQIEAENLQRVKEVLNNNKDLSKWLKSSAVALNGEIIENLNTPLKDGDTISILPPVCGG